MNKSVTFKMRISEQDKAALFHTFKSLGYSSASAYVMDCINNAEIKDLSFEKELWDGIRDLGTEINRIGNNLNQVVKEIHLIKKNILVSTDQGSRLMELLQSYENKSKELAQLLNTLAYGI